MGKLKQYEIDAVVGTIIKQIKANADGRNKTKFAKAKEEMAKLVVEVEAMEDKLEKLKKEKEIKGNQLASKLGEGVTWNNWMDEFSFYESTDSISIRNEVIINQLDVSSDVDVFIEKIVEKYSKTHNISELLS